MTIIAITAAGCGNGTADPAGGDGGESSTVVAEKPDYVQVADDILRCIKEGDAATMKGHLNKTNQRMGEDDVAEFLAEVKSEHGDVAAITEVRKDDASRYPEGTVLAKLKTVGSETFVFVLMLEEGKYVFEDVNSPGNEDYNALEQLWPKP